MTRRGRGLIIAGVVVMAAALVGGVTAVVAADRQADRFVADFARAPAGCDTAIRFDRTTSMDVWIETRGSRSDSGGSCPAPVDYDHGTATVPQVLVTVTDTEDGDALRLRRTTAAGYDRGGFIGSRFRTIEVTDGLTAVVRVEAPAGDQIVVAFGPDPADVGRSLQVAGIAIALVGLVLGFAVFVAGLIRRFAISPSSAPSNTPPWQAGGVGAPLAPPSLPAPPSPDGPPLRPPPPSTPPPPPPSAPPQPPTDSNGPSAP